MSTLKTPTTEEINEYIEAVKNYAIPHNYTEIDNDEKAEKLLKIGILKEVYRIPIEFGGNESKDNIIILPLDPAGLKEKYDSVTKEMSDEKPFEEYKCTPKYKGKSIIPCEIVIEAIRDRENVWGMTIGVW